MSAIKTPSTIALAVAALILPLPAAAYIGPGVGAGTIAVVLGIIGSVLFALFGIVYYPAKRAFKRWKASRQPEETQAPAQDGTESGTR